MDWPIAVCDTFRDVCFELRGVSLRRLFMDRRGALSSCLILQVPGFIYNQVQCVSNDISIFKVQWQVYDSVTYMETSGILQL